MAEDEVEILDVENYKANTEQSFSHQSLVMKVIQRCIETGTKEMRTGYYTEKHDKFGNKVMIYTPDTRKEFIESVYIAMSVMKCDFDDDAAKKIKAIIEKIDKKWDELYNTEKKQWACLNFKTKIMKVSNGTFFLDGTLNTKLRYYQEYIEHKVFCCQEILAELNCLTKRLNFYEDEPLSG